MEPSLSLTQAALPWELLGTEGELQPASHLPFQPRIQLLVHLSVHLSIYLVNHQHIHASIHLSIYPSIHPPIHPSPFHHSVLPLTHLE